MIAIAEMAVAFSIAIRLALVLRVILNYVGKQKGDPVFIFLGVLLVIVAIILNALTYRKNQQDRIKYLPKVIISFNGAILNEYLKF